MSRAVLLFLLVSGITHVLSEKAVICYYGTWATYRTGHGKFDVDDVDPFLCTHLIYAFAGIDTDGSIISLDPYLDLPDDSGLDNFGKFNALKQKNSNLKTLLAVGGWNEGSEKYSIMAADPTLRQNFISTSLQMLTEHGFDGLDLDWEYPARRDTYYGDADIENFSILLKELKEEYEQYGLLLTAAVSAVRAAASLSYDIPEISKYLDIINIMTYDMYGAWDAVTGHNAPLHKGEGDEDAVAEDLFTVDMALEYWISEGAPAEKIAVGVPFYGRTFTLTDANDNGVRAPSSGAGVSGPYTATEGYLGYNEFCDMLQTESWTQSYDDLAKVPYAFKDTDWVSYDNDVSITEKVNYAKSLNIDKIMIWSIETDDFHGTCGGGVNPLLNTINDVLDDESDESITTTSIPDNATSPSAATTISVETTDEAVVENAICHEEGYAVDPDSCSSFYVCVKDGLENLLPIYFACPVELYWDTINSICNY